MSKIKAVWFHSSITVPGLPFVDTSISAADAKKLDLELTPLGINIKSKDGKISAFTPIVNVKSVLFDTGGVETNTGVRLG